jgi:hypothetical protein
MGWYTRDPYLSSAAWKTQRQVLKAQWEYVGAPCARCGLAIHYDLAYPDPRSFALGHIISRAKYARQGITDLSIVHSVNNLQPEHLRCSTRSGRVEGNRSVARQDQYAARTWQGSTRPAAPTVPRHGVTPTGGGWRAYGDYAATREELAQLIKDVQSGKIIPRWP